MFISKVYDPILLYLPTNQKAPAKNRKISINVIGKYFADFYMLKQDGKNIEGRGERRLAYAGGALVGEQLRLYGQAVQRPGHDLEERRPHSAARPHRGGSMVRNWRKFPDSMAVVAWRANTSPSGA